MGIFDFVGNIWKGITGQTDARVANTDQNTGQTERAVSAGPAATASTSTAQGPDLGAQNQTRAQQMQLMQQLQQQASGQGPSLAQMQLKQAQGQNMAQAAALGQSQRGAGQGALLKNIQNQQAGIASGMANDSAMARLQEQMQARNMLGQNLSGVRGQDLGVAGMGLQNNQFNAAALNQGSQFNASANNQMNQFNSGQANEFSNANQNRAIQMAQLQNDVNKTNAGIEQENAKQQSSALGGMFNGAMKIASMAMSDENLKTDIKDADSAISEFLDKAGAHSYKYKDEKHGVGRRVSPMAQELEKSKLGEEMVFETPDGKAVDYGKGLGTMVSAMAVLHKRLKKIEED